MPRVICLGECMIELREHPDGLLSHGFGATRRTRPSIPPA
jgi:hypothetical protein